MRCKRIRDVLSRLPCTGTEREPDGRGIGVSKDQARALREATAEVLASSGEIATALDSGHWDHARRLRWQYECLFRLLDDLGWSGGGADATAITMSRWELAVALNQVSRYCRAMMATRPAQMKRYERACAASRALQEHLPFVALMTRRGW
jgi:hypothetical protein